MRGALHPAGLEMSGFERSGLLMLMMVEAVVPRKAPLVGFDNVIWNWRVGSPTGSLTSGTLITCEVTPGPKLSVPEVAM